MDWERLTSEIRTTFPNAEKARLFYTKQSIFLEEQHGFMPENTHFSEGGCADEINDPEYRLMAKYWGERFKFGGLAGYCHGGTTGLGALSHHVPEVSGRKNLLIVAGPHIGYHNGEWGKIRRRGQTGITYSCGSIAAVLEEDFETLRNKIPNRLDGQQYTIEQLLLPYLKECRDNGMQANILDATQFLMQKINKDLMCMIDDLTGRFEGKIALLTGITINTMHGNYFSPSIVKIFD